MGASNAPEGRGSMRPRIATVSLVEVVLLGPRHSRWLTPCDLSVSARVGRTFVCLLIGSCLISVVGVVVAAAAFQTTRVAVVRYC